MGKIKKLICIVLCLVASSFVLTACAATDGAPSHTVSTDNYVIPAEKLEEKLESFLDAREDRTT